MLELKNNQLVFRFPEVHPDCVLVVVLHRTLRIPDDGKDYPLPPSLGAFPMVHVDDYKTKVSPKWVGRGGVMVPMYQSEALWFSLNPGYTSDCGVPYPFAIKCATGKVSALTGKKWSKKIKADDYMVAPGQPWLDGYVVADGTVRQFVAAPLGLGVTAEGQITGKEEFGGLQLEVLPMLREVFDKKFPKLPPPEKISGSIMRGRRLSTGPTGVTGPNGPIGPQGVTGPVFGGGKFGYALPGVYCNTVGAAPAAASGTAQNYSSDSLKFAEAMEQPIRNSLDYSDSVQLNCVQEIGEESNTIATADVQLDMGLAAGGRMKQQVFKDPHGIECWDSKNKTRVFIHMANSVGWQHVTGALPPHPPLSAAQYTARGYPWFDYYEEGAKSQSGTDALKGLKSLAEIQKEKKLPLLPENQSTKVSDKQTVKLKKHPNQVRDGVWK
jgi:hypothetical protein